MSNALPALVGVVVVFVASLAPARTARADDDAALPVEGPQVPHVNVSAIGPEEAVLEERIGAFEQREAGWRQLCGMPCQTTATVDPYAEHRVVDGHKTRPVSIRGADGERLVVRYERAPASAGLLFGGGIVAAAAGAGVALTGLMLLATNVVPDRAQLSWCGSDAACQRRYDQAAANAEHEQSLGRTLAAAGAATVLVGGVAILIGALTRKPSPQVSRPGLAVSF